MDEEDNSSDWSESEDEPQASSANSDGDGSLSDLSMESFVQQIIANPDGNDDVEEQEAPDVDDDSSPDWTFTDATVLTGDDDTLSDLVSFPRELEGIPSYTEDEMERIAVELNIPRPPPVAIESTSADSVNRIINELYEKGRQCHFLCKRFWALIEERLETHPLDAREVHRKEGLPLHRLLRYRAFEPQLSVIRALIAAYPEALGRKDRFGNTPLHLTVVHKKVNLSFRTILYACRAAAKKVNRKGELPLHRTVVQQDMQFCWELLLVYPMGASVKDDRKKDPLQTLCYSPACEFDLLPERMEQNRRLETVDYPYWAVGNNTAFGREDLVIDQHVTFWVKAQLLLMAIHHGHVASLPRVEELEPRRYITIDPYCLRPEVDKFRALHAAVGTGSPRVLVDALMEIYPEQLYERDERGRYPLHWAAAVSSPTMFQCSACSMCKPDKSRYIYKGQNPIWNSTIMCCSCFGDAFQYAVNQGLDHRTPLPFAGKLHEFPCSEITAMQEQSYSSTFRKILDANTEAARVADNKGRFPLHHYAAADVVSCNDLAALLVAHPSALHVPDPTTGMIPIQAVVGNVWKDNTIERVDAVFQLLKMNPGCLKQLNKAK